MKSYVLDTTVLMDDPRVVEDIASNRENRVIIPPVVIKQLDNLKKSTEEEKSRKARLASRAILEAQGKYENITIATGIKPKWVDTLDNYADNRILGVCLALKEKGEEVYLMTTDVNMKIVAKNEGIILQETIVENKKSMYSPVEKAILIAILWMFAILFNTEHIIVAIVFVSFAAIPLIINMRRFSKNPTQQREYKQSGIASNDDFFDTPSYGSLSGFRDEEGKGVCSFTTTTRNSFMARFWEKDL